MKVAELDWKKIWQEFDNWYDHSLKHCSECDRISGFPEWSEQKEKIQALVKNHKQEKK